MLNEMPDPGPQPRRPSPRLSPLTGNPHDVALPPSKLPRVVQRVFVGVFIAGLLIAATYIGLEHWRRGAFVLGASLCYLAGLRACVDSDILGVLSVRSRSFDMAFSLLIGLSTVWLAISIDPLGS